MTTGKWAKLGVPHRGWICDNEEQGFLCQMCETALIRFIHVMEHEHFDQALNVGSICAGHMKQDLVRARERENDFKRLQSRRKNWLTRKWRVSHQGNDFLNVDGFNVVVYPNGNHWGARVLNKATGRQRVSQRHYETSDAAKLAALAAMLAMD